MIAYNHYFLTYTQQEQYFAVKRIERRESNPTGFMTEHRNLKSFKQCLGQNKNIMLSLTTFAHGSNFVIISRLADLDLNIFFEGSYNDFEKRKRLFTPISLLRESLGLAAALDFLHDGLRVSGGAKVACAHLDLKPANILVEWSSRPVGRWKIHDFGTSRIKEPPPTNPRDSGLKAPGDFLRQFSFTIAGRAPGPFQAPEVQLSQERVVGRESDMWSFGCILAFVLAFTTGGPKHITELVNALNEPIPDTTATTDFFYTPESIDKSNFIVKPKVVQWLTGLDIGNTVWVSNTLDLIFKTLAVDAKARPKASEVLDDLAIACRDGTNNFNAVCSWVSADEDLGAEIPHPISPLTKSPSIHSNREPSQTTDGPDSRPASVAIPSTPLSNSTSGSGLSETSPTRSHETSEPVLFMKLDAPRDTFRTTICPSSCHVAFLSKRLVTIHCLKNETNWAGKRPRSISHPMIHSPDVGRITCLDGYDWNYICLSDSYILLRAGDQRGREKRV
jgi:serine/threonine protein kinase